MHDSLRRIAVTTAALLLAVAGLYVFRARTGGYSVFDFLQGKGMPPPPRPEPFTPPNQNPVDLASVQILAQLDLEYRRFAQAVMPAVVSLDTKREVSVPRIVVSPRGAYRDDRTSEQPGLGSGVIVSREGHVLTCFHVIEGATEITATLSGGDSYVASVVGTDPEMDVAVLKIERSGEALPALPFGDSDEVREGQLAFAAGSPNGLRGTITHGIISGRERRLSDRSHGMLQTDAQILPGSSGGPLLNIRGEIVGLTSAVYGGQGLALASNEVRETFEAIMRTGRPPLAYLGIRALPEDQANLRRRRVVVPGSPIGVTVEKVEPDSPAAKAGLLPGDEIVGFGGNRLNGAEDLFAKVRASEIGSKVAIEVRRGGDPITLQTTMEERRPALLAAADPETAAPASGGEASEMLGVSVRNLTDEDRRRLEVMDALKGVLISKVNGRTANSPAGPQVNDIICQINKDLVTDVRSFRELLSELPAGQAAAVWIWRQGKLIQGSFIAGAQEGSG